MNVLQFEQSNLAQMTLNQNVTPYQDNDVITVAGWLELVNNNSAILWVQKDFKIEQYFVSSDVLKNYNVKMGDRVVVQIEMEANQWIVKNIFNINGCPILKFSNERNDYTQISHIVSNKLLKFKKEEFDAFNLCVGENVYVYGTNNNNNTTKIIEILNSCEIENKIYLNVSIADKNKIYLKDLYGCENFVADIVEESGFVRRLISLAIERAKRILEIGENVVFVVDDLTSVLGIDKDGINLVKNLVSIAKNGENMGSITVIAIMPNDNLAQVEKLADRRFKIDKQQLCELN